ncbi:MAG TPA: hypothetical protein PKA88_30605, partial [Polyangiaceae bacterium]|nr:hypothetical protein [Polyangiaceae bacterium]
ECPYSCAARAGPGRPAAARQGSAAPLESAARVVYDEASMRPGLPSPESRLMRMALPGTWAPAEADPA